MLPGSSKFEMEDLETDMLIYMVLIPNSIKKDGNLLAVLAGQIVQKEAEDTAYCFQGDVFHAVVFSVCQIRYTVVESRILHEKTQR